MVRALFFKWPHLKKWLFLKDDALTLCEREAPESEHRTSQKKKKQKLNTNDKHSFFRRGRRGNYERAVRVPF